MCGAGCGCSLRGIERRVMFGRRGVGVLGQKMRENAGGMCKSFFKRARVFAQHLTKISK